MRIVSQVAERLTTYDHRKLGNNMKRSELGGDSVQSSFQK